MFDFLARLSDKAKLLSATILLLVAVVGLIVTLIGWGAARGDVKAEAKRADTAELNLGRCEVDRDTAQAAVERQAAAVEQWKAEADRRQKAGVEAVRKAEKAAGAKLRRAQQIAARKPVGEVCEASRRLIVEVLSEERQ